MRKFGSAALAVHIDGDDLNLPGYFFDYRLELLLLLLGYEDNFGVRVLHHVFQLRWLCHHVAPYLPLFDKGSRLAHS